MSSIYPTFTIQEKRTMNITNFIKHTLLLAAFAVISMTAFAQQQIEAPAQKAKFQSQWMQNNLSLTDIQTKKVYTVVLHFAQLDETDGVDKRANSRTKDADLRAILSAGQYQKYHEHMQEMYTQEMQVQSSMPQNNK